MEILKRILANIIDIFIYLLIVVISFLFMLPHILNNFNSINIAVLIIFILTIIFTFIIQYPFLKVNQTIGKAFFSLEIITTNKSRPLDVSIIVQREIFGKIITCYLMCLPVLYGKTGGHEIITETKVVKKIIKKV